MSMLNTINSLNWNQVTEELNFEGVVILRNLFPTEELERIRQWGFQGSVSGVLPDSLRSIRETLYPRLAAIANGWNAMLGVETRYPAGYAQFLELNTEQQQDKSYFVLSMLDENGYEPLHQNIDGSVTFPLQLVVLLSKPKVEFTGGEIVMTEQRPRMQSRPIALGMDAGDVAIMTVSSKPSLGSKGYYRVNLKHAVSTVSQGTRYGIEIMFHNRE